VIEPGHLSGEVHAAPFEPQDLTRSTSNRECKLEAP
jgi:hypothetical protein